MMELQDIGRNDFFCMEAHGDFGGRSWIAVSNKFTKLQTEAGTYHCNYTQPWAEPPRQIQGRKYATWPSRDTLLRMMRCDAAERGLYQHAMFNTRLERVKVRSWSNYAIQHVPVNEEEGDGGMMMVSSVLAWPGFLHEPRMLEFAGEDS